MKYFMQLLIVATDSMPQVLQQISVRNPIAISLGAIAGALSRYYINLWFIKVFGNNFPYGTMFINLTGSFVMGLFFVLVTERFLKLPPEIVLLITVGFLGSYTTFSTYELDSIKLVNEGRSLALTFYWLGSPIVGLIAIKSGMEIVRILIRE